MNAALTLVSDQDAALAYLAEARKHHTQAAIAKHLGVGVRTISRWEARQTNPPAYLAHALQQLLPFGEESPAGAFDFIDLFAGIGGMRRAFEQVGGRCVYTSEWDSYAQKNLRRKFSRQTSHCRRHNSSRCLRNSRSRCAVGWVSLPTLLDSRCIKEECFGQSSRFRL